MDRSRHWNNAAEVNLSIIYQRTPFRDDFFRLNNEVSNKKLVFYANVRRFSRSRFFIRLLELIDDFNRCLSKKGNTCHEQAWLLKLVLLTDFSTGPTDINLELQGKGDLLNDKLCKGL